MTKYADRATVTKTVLSILKSDYHKDDLHNAEVTWWQNIRSTGGFGLTETGSKAFDKAELSFVEFDNGASSYQRNHELRIIADNKMLVPYYIRIHDKKQKIRVYDSRISLLIVLYDTIDEYLKSAESRNKK